MTAHRQTLLTAITAVVISHSIAWLWSGSYARAEGTATRLERAADRIASALEAANRRGCK